MRKSSVNRDLNSHFSVEISKGLLFLSVTPRNGRTARNALRNSVEMRDIKTMDYRQMFARMTTADHRIGEDVLLMDEFRVNTVQEYEFTATGNTFFEVLDGRGSITVNGMKYQVNGHCLIVYFQDQLVKVNISGPESVQRVAVFSDRFMEELYQSSIQFCDIRTYIIENPVIHINGPLARRLDLYVSTLREIASDADSESGITCAKFETLSLFYGPLRNCFRKRRVSSSRKNFISSGFFTILNIHFRTEHQLKYYAGVLNITDRYLYVCVMSVTGKSPSYWIDCYLMREAKKLLVENTLSINQIAEILGFSGPSQFGKFFKKHEGRSAGIFRANYSG